MGAKLEILVHGRGNAWPVPLGEDHPFYNRKNPVDLSNAAFSLQLREPDRLRAGGIIVPASGQRIQIDQDGQR